MSNTDSLNKKNYLKNKYNNDIKIARFTGCGMYDKYLLRKVHSFKKNTVPTEHILISNLLFQSIKPAELLIYQNILRESLSTFQVKLIEKNFLNFLEKMRNDYINFISIYIPELSNKTSQEYIDLIEMINNLIDILIYRTQYYANTKNRDTIMNDILTNLDIDTNTFKGGLSNVKNNENNIRSKVDKKVESLNKISLTSSQNLKAKLSKLTRITIPEHLENIEPYERYFATPKEFAKIFSSSHIKK
jgi:hypothetical protein